MALSTSVSTQNYPFPRTFKLAIISPDYTQNDIQKYLKATIVATEFPQIKMDFLGNDDIARVAIESINLGY